MSRVLLGVLSLVTLLGLVLWRAGGKPEHTSRAPDGNSENSIGRRSVARDLDSTAVLGADEWPATTREEAADSAPALDETIIVRVFTRASLARDAEPVGGIAFLVFAQGLPSSSRAPTPLAPFRLAPIPIGAEDVALAEGRTDEKGEALVVVPKTNLLFNGHGLPLVCARVVEPAYQGQVSSGKSPRDEGADCEVSLLARRGATARGGVVDAEGKPCAAMVVRKEWSASRGQRALVQRSGARLLAQGAFELDFLEPIAGALLLADAGEAGTGALGGVDLLPEAPPNDLHIVVSGPGILRGRVLDGAGEPAAGLDLLVQLASLDAAGSSVPPEPERSLREAEGRGHLSSTLQTDSTGAFEVRGLRAEPYVVRAHTGPGYASAYPELLTPTPIQANGNELLLRVARPHIVVRLLDAEGRPWPVRKPKIRTSSYVPTDAFDWPSDPIVQAFACHTDDGGGRVAGEPLDEKRLENGERLYEVAAGARYLVSARGAGFDGVPREVEMAPDGARVVVELRAREVGELGAVAVRVLSAGQEIGAFGWAFDVRLESRDVGVTLLETRGIGLGGPVLFRAPAGLYRVVAEGKVMTDYHGRLNASRTLGRAESEVELRTGLTQEVRLELDAGATLEVSLAGEPAGADREAGRQLQFFDLFGDAEEQRTRWASQAKLSLLHGARRPEPVTFEGFAMEGTSAAGQHLLERWPLGETHVSARLPTGQFTLLARLPGGRERRVEVYLRAGETSHVALEF